MNLMTRDVETLFRIGACGSVDDGTLLDRFVETRDEAAFEVLVQRHGSMVLGVCRRILGNDHDAEEAFQAVLLVLARRAAVVSPRGSVGNWLHGVATRTALKLRTAAVRRRVRERSAAVVADAAAPARDDSRELASLLDQELARLPARYRAAVILCDLEEQTRSEAASRLGLAEGTVASRLARGRKLLAGRLTRRGVAIGASGLASWLSAEAATRGAAPMTLAGATVSARAMESALGTGLGAISARGLILVTALTVGIGALGIAAAVNGSSGRHEIQHVEEVLMPPPEELSRQALVRDLKNVATDLLRELNAIEDLEQRVWLLLQLARTQGKAGLDDDRRATLERAEAAAEEAESDHRRIDVAAALAEAGQYRRAIALVTRIRDGSNRNRAAAAVAEGMASSGKFEAATQIAGELPAEPWKSQALWKAAVARADRGDVSGAIVAAGAIPVSYSRGMALCQIAATQIRAKDPDAARTLGKARETAASIPVDASGDSGPALRAELAGVLAESGSVAEAKALARSIARGSWGDIGVKNILKAQADRDELDSAHETYGSILDSSEKGEGQALIVAALARKGEMGKAQVIADTIADDFYRFRALIDVAKAHAGAGRKRESDAIFDAILHQAANVKDAARSGNRSSATFCALAAAQAGLGEADAVLAWLLEQASPLVRGWSRIGLIEGLAARLPARVDTGIPAGDLGVEEIARSLSVALVPKVTTPPVREPSPTFKGKLILFGTVRDGRTGGPAIEQMNPDGTGFETILTLEVGAGIESGRESSDGSKLAYNVTYRRGPDDEGRGEIWLLSAAGGRRKLTEGHLVAGWSPDGKRLAVVRAKDRALTNVILDVENGKETALPIPATDILWDWSPAGSFLAVMDANPGKTFEHPTRGTYPLRQVGLIHPDGSGRVSLTSGPPLDSIAAAFSPDGSRLAYEERRHIDGRVRHFAVVQEIPAGKPADLFEFHQVFAGFFDPRAHGEPCWSPDGERVVWIVPRRKTLYAARHPELIFAHVASGKVDRLDLYNLGLDWVQAIAWR